MLLSQYSKQLSRITRFSNIMQPYIHYITSLGLCHMISPNNKSWNSHEWELCSTSAFLTNNTSAPVDSKEHIYVLSKLQARGAKMNGGYCGCQWVSFSQELCQPPTGQIKTLGPTLRTPALGLIASKSKSFCKISVSYNASAVETEAVSSN